MPGTTCCNGKFEYRVRNKGQNCKDELKLVWCNDPLVKLSYYDLAKKQTFFIVAGNHEFWS